MFLYVSASCLTWGKSGIYFTWLFFFLFLVPELRSLVWLAKVHSASAADFSGDSVCIYRQAQKYSEKNQVPWIWKYFHPDLFHFPIIRWSNMKMHINKLSVKYCKYYSIGHHWKTVFCFQSRSAEHAVNPMGISVIFHWLFIFCCIIKTKRFFLLLNF